MFIYYLTECVKHVQTVILQLFEMFPSSLSVKLYLHTYSSDLIHFKSKICEKLLQSFYPFLYRITLQDMRIRYIVS